MSNCIQCNNAPRVAKDLCRRCYQRNYRSTNIVKKNKKLDLSFMRMIGEPKRYVNGKIDAKYYRKKYKIK